MTTLEQPSELITVPSKAVSTTYGDLSDAPAVPVVDAKQHRQIEVNEALLPAYQKASTLVLTEKERTDLTAPFSDEDVEKRPHDGLLYIPHIVISDRLCQVFGPGQWCTVRRREWIEGTRIYAEWVMLIRGCFIGESVGAMDYHPNNAKMNYSDALEGTRGECIRRIAAKELSCGSQVWRPSYCRQWNERSGGKRLPAVALTPRAKTKTPAAIEDASDQKTLLEKLYKLVPQSMRPDVNLFLQDFKWTDGTDRHWLLPSESLSDLPADKLRALVNKWDTFKELIDKQIAEKDAPPGAELINVSREPKDVPTP